MKPLIRNALASAAVFSSIASVAVAAPVSGTGAGFAVPDNNPAGASSAIVLTDTGTINSMSVLVAMSHTWVGDLIMTLSNGTSTIRLLDRPGVPVSTFGDSSNLSADWPITFAATATQLAEAMGAGAGCLSNDVVGVAPCSTDTFFQPEDSFGVFLGSAIAGTWTLKVSDNAVADTGSVRSWTLNADVGNGTVPEPTTLALVALALAGIGAAGRRKA